MVQGINFDPFLGFNSEAKKELEKFATKGGGKHLEETVENYAVATHVVRLLCKGGAAVSLAHAGCNVE